MNQIREMVEKIPVRKRGRERTLLVPVVIVAALENGSEIYGRDFGVPLSAGHLEPLAGPDEPHQPPPWQRRPAFSKRSAFRGRK